MESCAERRRCVRVEVVTTVRVRCPQILYDSQAGKSKEETSERDS